MIIKVIKSEVKLKEYRRTKDKREKEYITSIVNNKNKDNIDNIKESKRNSKE